MIAPRWRKVLRDVFAHRGRSALAVIAMAAGVFQICAMLYKYALLQPELTTMYGKTHPASATLVVDRAGDALIDSVRHVTGVGEAELRPVVLTRARIGTDEWVPMVLQVVRDFDHQRLDRFEPESGAWPPAAGEMLLERSALGVARAAIGDRLVVRTSGGEERTLRVSGTVHAAGLPPAWMEHMVPGFVGWDSSVRGERGGESAQIRIGVAEHPLDEGHVREVADSVQALLERSGHTVTRVTVPPPGHPHADQMEAFLYLLLSFGLLSFALSAVLVASMIHALMSEQVKQVGMMKAIGATDRQVAGLYLGQVGLLAVAALCIGVPLGLVVGRAYARFAAGILNADITNAAFPWCVIGAVVVVGIVVPLLAALGPVLRASRITVREALSDAIETPRTGGLDRWPPRFPGIPRPLMLSMRGTFARRGRLALTTGMMALGGAVFLSAMNVSAAWNRSVDLDFSRRHYDLTVFLAQPQSIASIARTVGGLPGVERAEYWAGASPYLIGPGGVPGATVALVGIEPESRLLDLKLAAGRWLSAADPNGAVINRAVLRRNPGLAVGDSVRLRLKSRNLAFPIVGLVDELTPMEVVYAPRADVIAALGQSPETTRSIRIVTREHDDAAQLAVARGLEREFERQGIEVSGLQRMLDARKGILDHLVIIMAILTMASSIVVLVGGLGLTSTLTLNVIQRTREIGILGAIGATPATIARHIWFEAVVIGVMSWGAACVLAIPISLVLERVTGQIFFRAPLAFHWSPGAAAIWLLLVIALSSLSSFTPARRAARLTVREALSHP